jgi:hypothetical protein
MEVVEIIKARFRSDNKIDKFDSKEYSFFCTMPVEVDDLLVVDTAYGPQLAKVSAMIASECEECMASRHVIQKVDTQSLKTRLERLIKMEKLRLQLRQKQALADEMKSFNKLAQKDDEALKLVQELEKLANE